MTDFSCMNCSAPAVVLHTRTRDELCDRCARDRTASERGEVDVAYRVLDMVIASLRGAAMTDAEIEVAVRQRLAAEQLNGFTDSGAGGCEPAWLAGFDHDERLVRLDG